MIIRVLITDGVTLSFFRVRAEMSRARQQERSLDAYNGVG